MNPCAGKRNLRITTQNPSTQTTHKTPETLGFQGVLHCSVHIVYPLKNFSDGVLSSAPQILSTVCAFAQRKPPPFGIRNGSYEKRNKIVRQKLSKIIMFGKSHCKTRLCLFFVQFELRFKGFAIRQILRLFVGMQKPQLESFFDPPVSRAS